MAPSIQTVQSVNRLKYVSLLLRSEFSITHIHCKIIETITIKNTAPRITPHHIVGVQALSL